MNNTLSLYVTKHKESLSILCFEKEGILKQKVRTSFSKEFCDRDSGVFKKDVKSLNDFFLEILSKVHKEVIEKNLSRSTMYFDISYNKDFRTEIMFLPEGNDEWKLSRWENLNEYPINEEDVKVFFRLLDEVKSVTLDRNSIFFL